MFKDEIVSVTVASRKGDIVFAEGVHGIGICGLCCVNVVFVASYSLCYTRHDWGFRAFGGSILLDRWPGCLCCYNEVIFDVQSS